MRVAFIIWLLVFNLWGQQTTLSGNVNVSGIVNVGQSSLLPTLPVAALRNWDTSIANTPTSGPVLCVGTPANAASLPGGGCGTSFAGTSAGMQSAVNTAVCGNIINVANITGFDQVILPSGSQYACSQSNWIWLVHDLSDTTFPAEGARIDPCYMGIAPSAMPYYNYSGWDACPSPARHVPQIKSVASSSAAAISIAVPSSGIGIPAPAFWRIEGLELTRDTSADIVTTQIDLSYQPANAGQDCALSGSGNTALIVDPIACRAVQPNHIIISRSPIHGDAQRQTTRAIILGGCRWCAIQDNFFYDYNLSFGGGGGDSQVIAGGNGHGYTDVGLWEIKNNNLSASTMSVLTGGSYVEPFYAASGADGIPHDFEAKQNFIWKNPLMDTQIGQAFNETLVIEGKTYPPAGDQEYTVQPTAIQLATGQSYQLQTWTANDSNAGINRSPAGTDRLNGAATTCNVQTANGFACTVFGNVGSGIHNSQNQFVSTFTAPLSVPAGGTVTYTRSFVTPCNVISACTQGANRTLTVTTVFTIVASNPTHKMVVGPAAPDLKIQPSYVDGLGNSRQFALQFNAIPNFTSASTTWAVDGVTGGNSSVGTIDSTGLYASPATTGAHTIKATASDGSFDTSVITVSNTAPIVAFDGRAFVSKNGFEFKEISRGWVHGNFIEVCWGGSGNGGGQPGQVFEFQSINQNGQVTDGTGATVNHGPQYIDNLTVQDNKAQHCGGKAFGIAAMPLSPAGLGLHNFAAFNNEFVDINEQRWTDGFNSITETIRITGKASGSTSDTSWATALNPIMANVSLFHNTVVGHSTNGFGLSNNILQFPLLGILFQDNIWAAPGANTFINAQAEDNDANTATGTGVNNTEARALQGSFWNPIALASCQAPNAARTLYCNVSGVGWEISVAGAAYTPTATPPGPAFSPNYTLSFNNLTDNTASTANFSSSNITHLAGTAVGFVNYGAAYEGNYALCHGVNDPVGCTGSSPLAGAAHDGTDMGAVISNAEAAAAAAKLGTRTP